MEYRFGSENWAFFVDGFWPEEHKITEVAGCFFHGCVGCKKYRNDEQRNRYQRAMERARFIEDRTDMDVEMEWECEIDNNPIFDSRQPNLYRYYCWKKAKDRKATTINPKLLLKMVEERVFFGMMEVDIEVPPHLTTLRNFALCLLPVLCLQKLLGTQCNSILKKRIYPSYQAGSLLRVEKHDGFY